MLLRRVPLCLVGQAALSPRGFTHEEPLVPVARYGRYPEFFDGESHDRFERKVSGWNVQIAERVGQEWPGRIKDARLDVKMGIRPLTRTGDFRRPMKCQELRSSRKCELIPILGDFNDKQLVAAIWSLNDADFLAAGEGKRLVTDKTHRIVSVQENRVDDIELERAPIRTDDSCLGQAANDLLETLKVMAERRPRSRLRHA